MLVLSRFCRTYPSCRIFSTCAIETRSSASLELTEPEALADFLRRGSATSASGSIDIRKSNFNRTGRVLLGLAIALASTQFCVAQEPTKKAPTKSADDVKVITGKESKWKPLLEKDSLKGWEITNFGGEGEVQLSDGVLRLERGEPLTGINMITKDFPKENFEMRWKASRVEGSDFLVGVTFPVGNEFCSLICGGWGGGLVGLSSIDGNDASENETTNFIQFKNKQWYSFRVRVDKKHITVWVDDKETVKVEREDKKFSLRGEVFKSKPVGYCAFQSIVDIKEWEYQTVE